MSSKLNNVAQRCNFGNLQNFIATLVCNMKAKLIQQLKPYIIWKLIPSECYLMTQETHPSLHISMLPMHNKLGIGK